MAAAARLTVVGPVPPTPSTLSKNCPVTTVMVVSPPVRLRVASGVVPWPENTSSSADMLLAPAHEAVRPLMEPWSVAVMLAPCLYQKLTSCGRKGHMHEGCGQHPGLARRQASRASKQARRCRAGKPSLRAWM